MKRLLIALIALVSISLSVNAQTTTPNVKQHPTEKKHYKHHRHRKFKKHHRRHHGLAQLNFSDAQKSQAKVYREEYRKKLQELDKKENITVKEAREQRMALRKEQAAKMQSLLTPEQKNKIEQFKVEGKAKMQQHYAARMDKMKAKLNLTDDQVAQLKTEREGMMAKLKAIKEDDTMDRAAKREKLMALRAEMKAAHQKIFTPEQLKQMEDMKKERMDKKDSK
ncbi:MAG: hypothetical protein WDM90_17965 [Ferruginibacter sp.]